MWSEPSVDELFRRALSASEEREREHAVVRLHKLGSREVFDRAVALTSSDRAEERALGAEILGQVDVGFAWRGRLRGESVTALLALGERERDVEVLEAVGYALGYRADARAASLLCRLAEHSDPYVRVSAAAALPSMVEPSGRAVPAALSALIELTRDPDTEVRSWALSGIGSGLSDEDGPEIREALAAALAEDGAEERGEAILGLALRNDPCALGAIEQELEGEPHALVFRAVEALREPSLLPAVLALREPSDAAAARARAAAIAALRGAAPDASTGG